MLLHMVLQQAIDPLSVTLISFFLAIIFLIPIIKWIFRQLKAQVELFLAAANQEDEENGMLEGS
jgi:H+/gluconate symporter-like permease